MSRRASITVRRPRDEVYRRWKEFVTQPHEASRFGRVQILEEDRERLIRFQAASDAEARGGGVARFVEAIGGQLTLPVLWIAALCLPATLGGAWLGARLYGSVSPQTFQRLVLCLLLVSGCILLAQTF